VERRHSHFHSHQSSIHPSTHPIAQSCTTRSAQSRNTPSTGTRLGEWRGGVHSTFAGAAGLVGPCTAPHGARECSPRRGFVSRGDAGSGKHPAPTGRQNAGTRARFYRPASGTGEWNGALTHGSAEPSPWAILHRPMRGWACRGWRAKYALTLVPSAIRGGCSRGPHMCSCTRRGEIA